MIEIKWETTLYEIISDIKKVIDWKHLPVVLDYGCDWDNRTWYAKLTEIGGGPIYKEVVANGMREALVGIHNYLKEQGYDYKH